MSIVSNIANKKVLLAITGGIAAYKAVILARLFKKNNVDLKIVMTESAKNFITPMTLQAVSNNKVYSNLFDLEAEQSMGHIELAKWADLIVIAPCSANIIAKLAHGMADDLLTTLVLASPLAHNNEKAKNIILAPAMNVFMLTNPQVVKNIETLKKQGFNLMESGYGEQACGDLGAGRMPEPEDIFDFILSHLQQENSQKTLFNKKVAITLGATIEPIDPVRYLSNYSSGKMGIALAKAFANLGAEVSLIVGGNTIVEDKVASQFKIYLAKTALDMDNISQQLAPQMDVFVGCAAVADYRVKQVSSQKIKKSVAVDELELVLVKNPDVLANVANMQQKRPYCVGFAAETENLEDYALKKLATKNLDLICANDVSNSKSFGKDSSEIVIYGKDYKKELGFSSKDRLADRISRVVAREYLVWLEK